MATWLRRSELAATEVRRLPWNEAGFRALLPELRSFTRKTVPAVFVSGLQEVCARHDVAVVFVPAPPGCPASGVTRWLTATKAMLVLSLRHKTNDHLWFAFFQEAGHLLLHSKKMEFLEGMDGLPRHLEEQADAFAQQQLIPRRFASELPTLRSASDVKEFAEHVNVHPGIVVGRLHHDRLIGWSAMAELKQRYAWADEE